MSYLILLALTLTQPQNNARANYVSAPDSLFQYKPHEQDRWFAMDKFWHLSASFATVGASYHLCANRCNWNEPVPTSVALAGTFTLGITKEFYDLSGPEKLFSCKDLVADILGIGIGYFVFIY
ncbi:hypothetical protein CH330_00765 [candidate division WOR-3 bacterium JGI_Cruoil_03_51_56]|uniref:Uncharacterized protein n=1 Tax=candidate division WOR-3 bacterium JGI_Cruoil_03_51_56 TaxID=1973747 RepID=A0A235BXR8_UNCW3|nr:MAG: hypothetical protein CH330_00765 [candidate division WOR-3 bacterium JGI_Cruoil_03_51_56]